MRFIAEAIVRAMFVVVKFIFDLFFGENGIVWFLLDIVIMLIEEFIDLLPDLSGIVSQFDGGSIVFVSRLMGRLNMFFPVVEGLYLLAAFLLFLVVFLILKAVLKLIPFIG